MTAFDVAKAHIEELHIPRQPYRQNKWGRPFSHEIANLRDRGLTLTMEENVALQEWFGKSIHDGTHSRCDWEPPWLWRY